jgi:hypothetical protein
VPVETKPVFHNSIELSIQLYKDYLVVVEGSIGTLEKLTFIIDTGAYPSMIDQRISTTLGLSERNGKEAWSTRMFRPSLPPCRSLRLVPPVLKAFQS